MHKRIKWVFKNLHLIILAILYGFVLITLMFNWPITFRQHEVQNIAVGSATIAILSFGTALWHERDNTRIWAWFVFVKAVLFFLTAIAKLSGWLPTPSPIHELNANLIPLLGV